MAATAEAAVRDAVQQACDTALLRFEQEVNGTAPAGEQGSTTPRGGVRYPGDLEPVFFDLILRRVVISPLEPSPLAEAPAYDPASAVVISRRPLEPL